MTKRMKAMAGQRLSGTHDAGREVDAARALMGANLLDRPYGRMPKNPLREGLRQTWNCFTTTRH